MVNRGISVRKEKKKDTPRPTCTRNPLARDFSRLPRRGLCLGRFTPPTIIMPRFSAVSFTSSQMPLSTRGASSVHEASRTGFPKSRSPATTRRPDEKYRRSRSRLRRWTYQDSHFCSRDVPGASRSELDADCRRFLALYTRHTFAFATRGPVGSGAPSRIPPRYTSLFSYDDDSPTVPSDHHSPLGQTPHSPSPANTRAAKKRSSPSSTNGFRSLPPSSSARAMLDSFFLSLVAYLRRYLGCALVLYDTFSEERRTYRSLRPWTPLGVGGCR